MQSVHTLVALPQWYVNARLDDLLRNGRTSTGESLQRVRLRTSANGGLWLSGEVSALGVEILVTRAPRRVRFSVQFASGTMDHQEAGAGRQADLKGLWVEFLANLAKAGVPVREHGGLPADVRERAAALPIGVFTVERLSWISSGPTWRPLTRV